MTTEFLDRVCEQHSDDEDVTYRDCEECAAELMQERLEGRI